MKDQTKGFLKGFVVTALLAAAANTAMFYYVGIPALRSTLDNNGLIFQEVDAITHQLHKNMDIAQRLSHYTDGHDVKRFVCPECGNAPDYIIQDIVDTNNYSKEEVKPTFNQLEEDSEEFVLFLQRIKSGLVNEGFALEHSLTGLRKKNE